MRINRMYGGGRNAQTRQPHWAWAFDVAGPLVNSAILVRPWSIRYRHFDGKHHQVTAVNWINAPLVGRE